MSDWHSLPRTQSALADAQLPTRGVFKIGNDLAPRLVYVVWLEQPADWQRRSAENIVYAAIVRHVMPGTVYPGCPWG
ncbi:hypothetical protein [Ruegeria arenilitoris]|uniref:hypothetical protein n=1 Tax=Ruegeria arenilitoris TaxID=1173585 RepID=UPI00147C7CC0|nr:hypothetical protein [Ruegeria arenilitoris]